MKTKLGIELSKNRKNSKQKKQPSAREKKDFVQQLMITMSEEKGSEAYIAADNKLKAYIEEFDCGCSFRDYLFKSLYNSVLRGNSGQVKLQLKLFLGSFKFDSLSGLAKKLGL